MPYYNRWSLDANIGVNKAVRNYAPGFGSDVASIGETSFGARFMANPYFGVDMKFGFDRFQDGKNSAEFATNMSRFGVQGIVVLSNVMKFYQWTDKIGLLFHTGVGLGNLSDEGFPIYSKENDKVGTLTAGLTPQLKIGPKMSLNMDFSLVALSRNHHTWDYTQDFYGATKGDDYGFNAHFFTGTIGLSYYLGKKESHADWTPTKSVSKEDVKILYDEMEKMRLGMLDDDKDGVPNYLDQELTTKANTPVDAKGVTNLAAMDSDKDGIPDAFDACPNEKGVFSTNGCPDSDMDGVADKDDKCPTEKGSVSDAGCAPKYRASEVENNASDFNIVYFATSSALLTANEKSKLDEIVAVMKANSAQRVKVKGHADIRGENNTNIILSKNRAQTVKNYLVQKGIAASRIETAGYGSNQPVQSNETESGLAKNRRVEFELF